MTQPKLALKAQVPRPKKRRAKKAQVVPCAYCREDATSDPGDDPRFAACGSCKRRLAAGLTMPSIEPCEKCKGTGRAVCGVCDGDGTGDRGCRPCHDTGRATCLACKGRGWVAKIQGDSE